MNFFKDSDADFVQEKSVPNRWTEQDYISVEKANRLLRERGGVVYGQLNAYTAFHCEKEKLTTDTHKALLINIEPIKKSPEDLGREYASKVYGAGESIEIHQAYEAGYLRAIKDNKI